MESHDTHLGTEFQPFRERPWMIRTLTVLFRRDPSRDRQTGKIHFEGYQPLWPDGHAVAVGLDALCHQGQRLLGLGKQLRGCSEKLIRMIWMRVAHPEDHLHHLPGYRVRRFFIERSGTMGRVHFMDGTPTAVVMDLERDEPRVVHWIGLTNLRCGERQWFDLTADGADVPMPTPVYRSQGQVCQV